MIKNNRKATRGRRVQLIDVPEFKTKGTKTIINKHPKAGKIIQVRHLAK